MNQARSVLFINHVKDKDYIVQWRKERENETIAMINTKK